MAQIETNIQQLKEDKSTPANNSTQQQLPL